MNKKFITSTLLASAIIAVAAPKSDPVLMTVGGDDVRLSEFEYLYNKNNSQQVEPISFDQYVSLFIDYKLKVADAKAAGIDTTKAFVEEFNKFRDELATPYLRDQATLDQLVSNVYGHMGEEVQVSHIMISEQPRPGLPKYGKEFADSLRDMILNGEIAFEDAARRYSMDKQSAMRGGLMGWVTANGPLPWNFEDACYETEVGALSPIINSGYGLHIIRPEAKRPASGEVNAQHILIMTRDLNDEGKKLAKARIDSIYTVLTTTGADFAEVAKVESQDPGSARRGGDLGWFGRGRMVAEFDSVAFALADGEISTPFATDFGYHIIKRNSHRGGVPLPPIADVEESIIEKINSDSRASIPEQVKLQNIAKENKSQLNENLADEIAAMFAANGITEFDDIAIRKLRNSSILAYTLKGKPVSVANVMSALPIVGGMDLPTAINISVESVTNAYNKAIHQLAIDQLINNNPEYANLIKEYQDGILLFEISNKNIWERAANDEAGLIEFFEQNRDNYSWPAPKFKSFVIFADSDSILTEAKEYANALNGDNFNAQDFMTAMKEKFGRKVKVERVIAAEGENPITDYLGFGKERPENKTRWYDYFAFRPQIIAAPQEYSDVKGQVTADYQSMLERDWVSSLHDKYPVKINKKTMKKAAQQSK